MSADGGVVVDGEDHAEGEEGDEDFAEDAYEDGAPALVNEVGEFGAKANSSEGWEEGPLAEVAERGELRSGEESDAREDREGYEAEDELGEFLPEEEGFAFDAGGLALRCPVDGVAEDDEADEGGACGLGEDSDAAGEVAVEGSGDGGFGGIVDGEAGPDAIGLLGHVECVADGGEGEEGERAQGEDGGDGGGGVFLVGIDGALRGHDGGDAAYGAADGKEADQFGRELEDAAEEGHDAEGEDEFDGYEGQGEATDAKDVGEDELGGYEDDAELEPELVGGDAGKEDAGEGEEVGEDEAEDDGPEDVLDAGEVVVVGAEINSERLEGFAGEADGEEKKGAGEEREELLRARRLASGRGQRNGLGGRQLSALSSQKEQGATR